MKPVNPLAVSAAVAVITVFLTARLFGDQPRLRDTLRGPDQQISSVVFSPDGKTLASSSLSTNRIWNLTSGKSAVVKSRFLSNAPFSADGQTLLLSGASSYPRQLYDVKSGRTTTVKEAPGTTLIAFSRDGRTEVLSRGFNDFMMRHLAGSFDLSAGQSAIPLTGAAFPGLKQSATFSPDGKTLVMRDKDQNLMLWNVASEKNVATLPQTAGNWYVFSPDGKTLAAACSAIATRNISGTSKPLGVRLFDVDGGRNIAALQETSNDPIAFATFSADGNSLAAAGVYAITIHSASSGKTLSTLEKPRKTISPHIVWSSQGNVIAALCHDGTVTLWDVARGKISASLAGASTPPALTVDGKILAFGCADGSIQLWDIPAGNRRP